MRFMLFIYPHPDAETGKMPEPKHVEAMMKYNEELAKAGVLLALDGLHGSREGARIKFSTTGKPTVTDGPFSETKEIVGGYWLIQVRSKEEALEWAKRCPVFDDETTIELRRVFEMSDFPADVQKAADSSVVKAAVEKRAS